MMDMWYAVGIIASLILGIWNIINSFLINKKSVFINSVTSERIKWIGKLRENISRFCGLTWLWVLTPNKDFEPKDKQEIIKEIDTLRMMIKLQLNPDGVYDKKIIELLDHIPDLEVHSQVSSAINELIHTTQFLLKEEWEKVKEEAKRGDLSK